LYKHKATDWWKKAAIQKLRLPSDRLNAVEVTNAIKLYIDIAHKVDK
jgi:hypothetical protein